MACRRNSSRTLARWLGVQVEGRPEESRILLVAVPYALKAADADTLGGKPASAFVLSTQEKTAPASTTVIAATATNTGSHRTNLPRPARVPRPTPAGPRILWVSRLICSWRSFATAGVAKGVYGRSFSNGGIGVHGDATTTAGATRGVWGSSASTGGIGVYGQASATSGTTYGVSGTVASPAGIAVLGQANAASGTTTGLLAKVLSTTGVALVADNAVGGKVLSARNNGVEKFSVAGDGNVKLASGGKITFPDSSVQSRASNVSGPETLRILRGTVNTNGAILAGSGFAATRNGAGDFTITYSTAFSGQPSVVATAAVVSPAAITTIILSSALATSARIGLVNAAGTAQDTVFEFIAIGPP